MTQENARNDILPGIQDDFNRLKLVVNQSPSAVVITDRDGTIEFGNRKFFLLTGYSFDEVKGQNISMLNSHQQPKEFYAHMWEDLFHGQDWKGEFRNRRKNGELYWVLASISPYFDKEGEISHYIGILEDITYLKQIELELKQSEEKFRVLFETLPEGIVVTDMEGYILQINQACLEIFRHNDRNRFLGKNIKEIVTGDSMEILVKLFLQAERHGYSKLNDYRLPYDDPVYVDVQVSLMKGSMNEDIGFVILIGDITESKVAEKALKESEARNRALVEAVPDIMFRVNDEGLYLDKMLGSKINEVFPQEAAVSTVKYISDAIKNREIQIFEYPVISGGKEEYYEARFVAIEDNEVLVILRNVTERRNAMEAIEEARREAELANRSKGEFLANMSHEIRTPLNSITGFLELLMRTGVDDTQREYLDIIKKSASGLLGIINDILDFSKIESNRLEINNVEFNPYVEFESVASLFNIKAREKGVVFLSFIDPRLPSGIISDPLRIKQILSNLLSNAIKFTPERGCVRVDISLIEKMENRCLLYFMVSDTGIGIPPRKQSYIFEAFAQADSSITRRFGGTGLGLSISSNLARLLDSEIIIESEAGVGSRFFFSLEPEISDAIPYTEKFPCDKNASIYLYSDDTDGEMILNNVQSYLSGFGCNYITGDNINDFNNQYDLVIALYSENLVNYFKSNPDVNFTNPVYLVTPERDDAETGEIIKYFKGLLTHPLSPEDIVKIIPGEPGSAGSGLKTGKGIPEVSVKFRGNVLVGEDDKTNQKLIKLLLADYGIKTDIAGNGLDVYDMFRKNRYNLVLMDMHMPVADGMETTQMIIEYEKKNSLEHTPVVALTAKAFQDKNFCIDESGLDGYLTKPIEIEKLEEVFNRYLEQGNVQRIEGADDKRGTFSAENSPHVYNTAAVAVELKIPEPVLINIAGEFLNDAKDELVSLREAIKSLSFDEIYLHAHKLKGACVNLRLEKPGEIFYEIEENAGSGNKEFDYCKALDNIENELVIMGKIILSGS
jgi:PAS domain S-box-containing protein